MKKNLDGGRKGDKNGHPTCLAKFRKTGVADITLPKVGLLGEGPKEGTSSS